MTMHMISKNFLLTKYLFLILIRSVGLKTYVFLALLLEPDEAIVITACG